MTQPYGNTGGDVLVAIDVSKKQNAVLIRLPDGARKKLTGILLVLSLVLAGCGAKGPPANAPAAAKSVLYDDLLALWRQFRDAQKPNVAAGVPDYTAEAMSAELPPIYWTRGGDRDGVL